MRQQLLATAPRTVLTYTTGLKNPRYQYLQVYVLNYNTSQQTWTLVLPETQASAQVGNNQTVADYGVTRGTSASKPTTKITLSQGTVGYDAKLGVLPVPYAPTKLTIPENGWLEDHATQMVYATEPQMSGLQYSVTSTEVSPQPKQENLAASYPASVKDNYLYFPAGPHGELAKLARQITSGASTPYYKARKLESYFQSGKFTYSLSVNLPNGLAGLIEFLYSTRTGYCQQFAFAMAGLARLVGIPSRIAVGYTAGTNTGKGDWKVTTADAHAWPELYFRGMGWLRFEPTPGGAAGQGTATVPQYAAAGGAPPGLGQEPTTLPTHSATGKLGKGANANLFHLHHPDIGGGGAAAQIGRGHSIIPWVLLVVAILAALALVAPATARGLIRRRRLLATGDAALAHAAWRELRDDLTDYGLACRPSESPRAAAARIGAALQLDRPRCRGARANRHRRGAGALRNGAAALANPARGQRHGPAGAGARGRLAGAVPGTADAGVHARPDPARAAAHARRVWMDGRGRFQVPGRRVPRRCKRQRPGCSGRSRPVAGHEQLKRLGAAQ